MPPPALPHDVWLNIARFIPILALRALYPVNHDLFHIALDARYRQISFIYWDDRLLRNLIRLKDPYIARRVKILHIYPGFLKEVIDKLAELTTRKDKDRDRDRDKHSLRLRLADIAHQLRECQDKVFPTSSSRSQADRHSSGSPQNLYDLPPRQSLEKLRERLKTPQDVMHAVLDLLRSLPSLTDYYVTWYGLPTAPPFADSASSLVDSDALSFINLVVPCIGTPLLSPSLTKLSLDISLENVHALCSASFHIARLEHLHLHLHSDHQLSLSSLRHILHPRLTRSVSHLSSTLRLLSIEAHEPMDIGPFFKGLDRMEKLETLSLAIPLQKPHLGNPKSLGLFLSRQAETIKVLRLRATQHDAGGTGSASHWRRIGTPDPWSLHSWVRAAFGSETGEEYQEWFQDDETAEPLGEYDMDSLESLEVSSNHMPLETALYCAERFGARVRTLGLLGSTKSYGFVKEVVKALAHPRRSSSPCPSRATLDSVMEETVAQSGEENNDDDDADDDDVLWQWLTPSPVSRPSEDETRIANTTLRTLRLGPIPLSPQLLDLLAACLPNLDHLELIVKHFLPSQDDIPIYGASRLARGEGDGVQLEDQVYEFLETLQNEWVWPSWGLKSIAVYTESAALSMPLSMPLLLPSSPPPSLPSSISDHDSPTPALPISIPLSSSSSTFVEPPPDKSKVTPMTTHQSSSSASLPYSSTSSKGSISSSSASTITMRRRIQEPSRSSVTLHVPISTSAPISRSSSASASVPTPLSSSTSALPSYPSPSPLASLRLPPFHSVSTPVSPVGLPSPHSTTLKSSNSLRSSPTPTPAPNSSRTHVFSFFRTRSKLWKEKEKDKGQGGESINWNSSHRGGSAYEYTNIGLSQNPSNLSRSQNERRRERERLEDLNWPSPNRAKSTSGRRSNRELDGVGRRRRRNNPASSFGSVSSGTSSIGLESESSEFGGGREDGRGAGAATEEKITLEVALAEVLTRCLPGVRVVR